MTRLLAVPRSGYYKWRTADPAGSSEAHQHREYLDAHGPMDLVDRRFGRGELDRVYLGHHQPAGRVGLAVLCAVRDGCSRRVIVWAIEDHMHTDLVEPALTMAVTMSGDLPNGWSSTQTAAPSAHPVSWLGSPESTTWRSRSVGPVSSGTKRRMNHSGPL